MLWNDSKTYEFLAKDDFVMYVTLYLSFLSRIPDEDMAYAEKGLLNISDHMIDFYNTKVAVDDDSEKRFDKYKCWFGTLSYYIMVSPTIVKSAELDELSKMFGQLFKTDEIYREMPEVIKRAQPNVVKFYRLISETNSYSEFSEKIRKEISNNCDNLMKEALESEKRDELSVGADMDCQ